MELVRCANCLAPLRLDGGPIASCAYCGAQTRLDAPGTVATPSTPTGAHLAEAVAFVTKTFTFPFLEPSAPLPLHRTQTLSTHSDDQDALDVLLVQGATPLVQFRFPITKRGPRGVPKIALTVRVSAAGAMSLTLIEPGTPNALDRDGIQVRIAGV